MSSPKLLDDLPHRLIENIDDDVKLAKVVTSEVLSRKSEFPNATPLGLSMCLISRVFIESYDLLAASDAPPEIINANMAAIAEALKAVIDQLASNVGYIGIFRAAEEKAAVGPLN